MAKHTTQSAQAITVKWITLVTSLVVALLIGFSLGQTRQDNSETKIFTDNTPSETYYTETHLGRNGLTNPFVDYSSSDSKDPKLQSLKQKLETEVAEFKSKESISELSLHFRNLDTGEWFGIGENEQYTPASLMKTTLMVMYYKLAESHPGLLEGEITYQGQYADNVNLPPAMLLAHGASYTVDDLIRRMIVHSDNIARSLLTDYLSAHFEKETIAKLIDDSKILIPANYEETYDYEVTAKNISGIFRVLYNATYLTDEMSEKALELLAESSYDSGIVNGIPEGVVVANKFGFSDTKSPDELQFHDCGIVYAEEYPYILCVLTKTKNMYAAQGVISSISKTVYQHLYPAKGEGE